MKSFNPTNEQEKVQFVLDNISNYEQISLATVNEDNQPWVVCVNYNIDENFNFFWKSEKKSIHSLNIKRNPKVGIMIFFVHKDFDFAFYSEAVAREVTDNEEIQKLIDIKYTSKGREKSIADFDSNSKNSLYIAEIKSAAVCDKEHKKASVDLEMLLMTWDRTK